MVLGGLALAFSRLIDNSVVVLENIFRHLEMGETPEVAAEKGGQEVAMPVLAATFTTAIVFFPVVFLYGVSRFLFTALAAAVVFSLFASYGVAMTVVPLFCAQFIKSAHNEAAHHAGKNPFQRFVRWFNRLYDRMLMRYDIAVGRSLLRPMATAVGILGFCLLSLGLYPLMGLGFFPRTDPGQFVINIKAPTGSRLELTNQYIKHVEGDIRAGGFAPRFGHDCFQYRHHAGFLGDLYAQFRPAHSVCASQLKERAFGRQLRVHAAGPDEAGR